MDDSAKYLIRASLSANGVVERSDVVGAIFGQTEGLLGDELDLRDLQQSSKVGRIDVTVRSDRGVSNGEITIASSMDRIETAILAASLETIERVGPCHATISITRIEDVRAAKRREVVDRASELLETGFDKTVMTSHELVQKVRENARIDDITEYNGYPAGPRVADSDAIVIVEGRADVLALLRYGIKNAVAVEGTNVPDEIAELTNERTVTAFLDGDRGGELILKELTQVGDVDFVTFAPPGLSVEELERQDVLAALRKKVPFEQIADENTPRMIASLGGEAASSTGSRPVPFEESSTIEVEGTPGITGTKIDTRPQTTTVGDRAPETKVADSSGKEQDEEHTGTESEGAGADTSASDEWKEAESPEPLTLQDHVTDVIDTERGMVRLLDDQWKTLTEASADEAYESLVEERPEAMILDGVLTQRVLDVAAQRNVNQIIARNVESFVKRPTEVRIRTFDQLLQSKID